MNLIFQVDADPKPDVLQLQKQNKILRSQLIKQRKNSTAQQSRIKFLESKYENLARVIPNSWLQMFLRNGSSHHLFNKEEIKWSWMLQKWWLNYEVRFTFTDSGQGFKWSQSIFLTKTSRYLILKGEYILYFEIICNSDIIGRCDPNKQFNVGKIVY